MKIQFYSKVSFYSGVICVLLLVMLTGCGGTTFYNLQDSKHVLGDEIAILRLANKGFWDGVKEGASFKPKPSTLIYEVDGKKNEKPGLIIGRNSYDVKGFDSTIEIHLSPGEHTVLVGYSNVVGDTTYREKEPLKLVFNAEAGKIYTIELKTYQDDTWGAKIVEVEN